MNSDEIKSLVVKILLVVFSSLAAKYHISGDTVTAVASDVADLGVIGYGIYDHWNMKKVAETAKVVGALLFVFLVMQSCGGFASSSAMAATVVHKQKIAQTAIPLPLPKPATVAAAPATAIMAARKQVPLATAQTNLISVIEAFSVTDLQNALADANAQTPPDTAAAACWQALLNLKGNSGLNPLPTTAGAFEFIQKGRDDKALLAGLLSPTGPLSPVLTACAPIVIDVKTTIIGLGLAGGVIAAAAVSPATAAAGAAALGGAGAGLALLKTMFGL